MNVTSKAGIFLPAGQKLSVLVPAGALGNLIRQPTPPETQPHSPILLSGSDLILGPYNEPAQFLLVVDKGTIGFSITNDFSEDVIEQTVVKTSSFSLVDSDGGKVVPVNSASAVTVTVPDTLATGFHCLLDVQGTGGVTIAGAGFTPAGTLVYAAQNTQIAIRKRGPGSWIVKGA